jgi:putative sigma-54 modulation protein
MNIIIKGRQMEVSPRLRLHIEQKVKRLSRFVGDDARIEVTVVEEKIRSGRGRYSVQLALTQTPHPIRSEVSAINANAALDIVLDKVTAQLGRHKDRKTTIRRHHTPAMKILSLSRTGTLAPVEAEEEEEHNDGDTQDEIQESIASTLSEERNEEIWSRILEIRHIPTKPMNDQEVIEQMEALGASFYPFFNQETNSVNVMYRLEQGGYGLLVPALE